MNTLCLYQMDSRSAQYIVIVHYSTKATYLLITNCKLARRHLVVVCKFLESLDWVCLRDGGGELDIGLGVFMTRLESSVNVLDHRRCQLCSVGTHIDNRVIWQRCKPVVQRLVHLRPITLKELAASYVKSPTVSQMHMP